MNEIIKQIFIKAKSNPKKIVLADTHDPRIQKAAKIAKDQKIAIPILLTDNYIQSNTDTQDILSQNLFELRKEIPPDWYMDIKLILEAVNMFCGKKN